MFPGLPPARRRLRAVRHQLRRRRRLIAATLTALAVLSALRTLAPAPPATVEVLVAARDMPSGALLGEDDVVSVSQGLLAIRTHADVCDPRLLGVEALLEVKKRVAPYINLQLAAFPPDGLRKNQ